MGPANRGNPGELTRGRRKTQKRNAKKPQPGSKAARNPKKARPNLNEAERPKKGSKITCRGLPLKKHRRTLGEKNEKRMR